MFDDSERNSFLRPEGGPLLNVVIHTASLEARILASDREIHNLLRVGELSGIRMVCTPSNREEVQLALKKYRDIELASYVENGEWIEFTAGFLPRFRERVVHLGDWARPAEPGSRVSILDELFTRPFEVDLFVVAGDDPFLVRDPARRHYVNPKDALELIRILLVSLDRYQTARSASTDENVYWGYRTSKLMPMLDRADLARGIGARTNDFPRALADQIVSLTKRAKLLIQAADKIGREALRRPDSTTVSQAEYHLSYLILLVTGMFDELGWIVALHHGFEPESRDVDLRMQGRKQAFSQAVRKNNPSLHDYLSESRISKLLDLFYPARNHMQHRGVLSAEVRDVGPGQRLVWHLPDETLRIIQTLAPDAGRHWGMFDGRAAGYIDPHLFVLAAVESVAEIANGVLSHLDWMVHLATLEEDEQARARNRLEVEIGISRWKWLHSEPCYY